MALKKKSAKADVRVLPPRLDSYLKAGMTASVLEKHYEAEGKTHREEIKRYFEQNDDGFDVNLSESFKTEYGSVTMKQRSNYSFDTDEIVRLVKEGKITVETLVAIASFNAEKLKTAIGDKRFSEIASLQTTEYLELRPSSDFKAEVQAVIDSASMNVKDLSPVKTPKPAPAAAFVHGGDEDVLASLQRIKSAKAKAKKNSAPLTAASADDDLDSILSAAGGDK